MAGNNEHRAKASLFEMGCGAVGAVVMFAACPVVADSLVVPDGTLGAEGSVVTDIDAVTQQIGGGAVRGSNLFHSFLEFNIAAGNSVYFANPDGIDTILSRVTGSNASEIFGRLGVLGDADLFLLNPNGIVFGENASLDVNGSFYAATADAIPLGGGVFSAGNPQSSSLLTVRPDALFTSHLSSSSGDITSTAQLSAGENVALVGRNVQLQGQVVAGADLTLLAQDTLTVRDSATRPFVAQAGGDLTLQGTESVDIFALNSPDSGLFAGSELVLRSNNPVIGDGHFFSGSGFRVEALDSSSQSLHSPTDPIILARGDVTLNGYAGTSLHILAGGSVTFSGSVNITGAGPVNSTINPNNTALFNGTTSYADLATFEVTDYRVVTAADGTVSRVPTTRTVVIDGSTEATLDVRAGVDWAALGGLPSAPVNVGTVAPAPTYSGSGIDASITLNGRVRIDEADGRVVLTNQFQPNQSSSSGTITTDRINTSTASPNSFGGDILIYSRGDIGINDDLDTRSQTLSAGDIALASEFGSITASSPTARIYLDARSGLPTNLRNIGIPGYGGDISVSTQFGDITLDTVGAPSNAGRAGRGGEIMISSGGGNIDIYETVQSTARGGDAGDIFVFSESGDITTHWSIAAASIALDPGVDSGAGGDIIIASRSGDITINRVNNSAILTGSVSRGGSSGAAGDITITTLSGDILIDDELSASSFDLDTSMTSSGAAGNISITSRTGDITVSGDALSASSFSSFGDAGTGGDIQIATQSGSVRGNNTLLLAYAVAYNGGRGGRSGGASGVGGNVSIEAGDTVSGFEALTISSASQSGDLFVQGTGNLTVENIRFVTSGQQIIPNPSSTTGTINLNTLGFGPSGDTVFTSTGDLTLNNVEVLSNANGPDTGGNIFITDADRVILNDTTLQTDTQGLGAAGSIFVQNVGTFILRNNSLLLAEARGGMDGGNIDIDANVVIAIPGENSDIIANAVGGNGGQVDIDAIGIYGFDQRSGFTTNELRANGTSDISASSQFGQQGVVNLNSLIVDPSQGLDDLEDGFINPDELISTSCIARSRTSDGAFVVTGTDGLPLRPDDAAASAFPATSVQAIPAETAQPPAWEVGDPIVEPDGAYAVTDGRVVLSRACE